MRRKKLHALRISKGLTQEEMAHGIGVTRAFYTLVELGRKNFSIDTWSKLGSFLDIPNDELASYMFEEGGTENVKEDHMQDGSGCNGDSRANAESCAAGRCV